VGRFVLPQTTLSNQTKAFGQSDGCDVLSVDLRIDPPMPLTFQEVGNQSRHALLGYAAPLMVDDRDIADFKDLVVPTGKSHVSTSDAPCCSVYGNPGATGPCGISQPIRQFRFAAESAARHVATLRVVRQGGKQRSRILTNQFAHFEARGV